MEVTFRDDVTIGQHAERGIPAAARKRRAFSQPGCVVCEQLTPHSRGTSTAVIKKDQFDYIKNKKIPHTSSWSNFNLHTILIN